MKKSTFSWASEFKGLSSRVSGAVYLFLYDLLYFSTHFFIYATIKIKLVHISKDFRLLKTETGVKRYGMFCPSGCLFWTNSAPCIQEASSGTGEIVDVTDDRRHALCWRLMMKKAQWQCVRRPSCICMGSSIQIKQGASQDKFIILVCFFH
jgi:hypothetical protein